MKTTIIDGNTITYFTKEELPQAALSDFEKQLYDETYKIAEFMCNQLKITTPNIAFSEQILTPCDDGRISVEGAKMYTQQDVPSLENDLILMSLEDFDTTQFIGTLAHELRHIWQDKYHSELNEKPAKGFEESLMHPAEIDADGYSIWYLSETPGMCIEIAAGIMCPEEKKHYSTAYMYRIEKAKEIKAYFDAQRENLTAEKNVPTKQKKTSFLDTLKHLFN